MTRPTSGLLLYCLAIMGTLLFAECSLGQDPDASSEVASIDSGDTAWILISTALVLFMTIPGLALFYGGLVRTKNVLSILMQCLALTALMSVVWVICGYTLAFDSTGMVAGEVGVNSFIGGTSKMFLSGITGDTVSGTIPEILFVAFQMTFAIITPALMIGAFAERMKFSATMLFSTLWLLCVYLPICHMTWGGPGAYFADWGPHGVFDFAGGIVVHITAGFAALVACIMVGPRKGYPKEVDPPHNMTMTVTGTAMLWVGWFGFNAGSALAANGQASMALLVTHLSASTATLVWIAIEWFRLGKPSALGAATGSIAGLAAITPASGFVGPLGALAIGFSSGVICYVFAVILKRKLKYDDTLDVFGVHGVGGFVGVVLAGVFASTTLGGSVADLNIGEQVGLQFMAAAGTAVFSVIASFVLLFIVSLLVGGLRVTESAEREGLDLAEHGERGYIA